jgi:2-succinyl-5-enolpyruvyl-6-hydroxy-3-cyclohexene-1-carboxylate synthase
VSTTDATTASATPAAPLRAITAELVAAGMRDVVVCPGSRSTPLALALAAHPRLRLLVDLDERGAGFLALGLAKASRRPVGVLVTSGTAAANLLPAAVEASLGRVPLVLLTADRPPELRDRGAPQTVDQLRMFGRSVRWDAELPVPADDPAQLAHIRSVVARAVATAVSTPQGPVHLDLPYREPLLPDGSLSPASDERPFTSVPSTTRIPGREASRALAERIARAHRPLIWCGPMDRPGFADAVTSLAARLEAPILADGLANLRNGPHDRSRVITRTAVVLRSAAFRGAHRPDLVIRFGGTPTARATLEWLAATGCEQVVVDDGGWDEPTLRPSILVRSDPVELARMLADTNDLRPATVAGWLNAWLATDTAADRAIRDALRTIEEPFEGAVFAELEDCLPEATIVWAGSSMPVRDLDTFLAGGARLLRCLSNRGANGIDGVLSSAMGAAAAGAGPVLLVLGDLSFLHDLNALATARVPDPSLTVLLVDNDGGGIFSFLPQATADRPDLGLPDRFEQLLGTPHGTDLSAVARALGAEVAEVHPGAIGAAVAGVIGRPGIHVLRLRTDRARNVDLHARVLDAALEAIA